MADETTPGRLCAHCGGPVPPGRHGNARSCSVDCSRAVRKERHRASAGRNRAHLMAYMCEYRRRKREESQLAAVPQL